jgi:hypothetical protein
MYGKNVKRWSTPLKIYEWPVPFNGTIGRKPRSAYKPRVRGTWKIKN